MTVIVGICDGRSVHMASDSFAGNGYYALRVRQPKLIKAVVPNGGAILYGVSGDSRAAYLLSEMEMPERPPDVSTRWYIGDVLVNAIRERFRAAGYLIKENEQDKADTFTMLVGYDGRLFSIWNTFDVVEADHNYMAVGSGMEVSLGALFTTIGIDPLRRLEMVMEATAEHQPYVCAPFHYEGITAV